MFVYGALFFRHTLYNIQLCAVMSASKAVVAVNYCMHDFFLVDQIKVEFRMACRNIYIYQIAILSNYIFIRSKATPTKMPFCPIQSSFYLPL